MTGAAGAAGAVGATGAVVPIRIGVDSKLEVLGDPKPVLLVFMQLLPQLLVPTSLPWRIPVI